MSNINEKYIEDYIRSVIPEKPEMFKKIEKYAFDNHVPIVHPEVAQFLRVLIKITNTKRVLEIGTAIGYSALIMAYAMKGEGKITTIERREDMIQIAEKNVKDSRFSNNIEIIKGEAQDVLPNINGEFDLIFLDGAKSKYMDFLPYCIDFLVPGGIIVSDNVLYKGMIANDDLVPRRQRTIVRKMREYLDYINNNPVLESSIIPIGDGVAISYKKEVK